MQKKDNKVWKQYALPGVGEFIETLSLTLFWGSIANITMNAGTFYFTTLRFTAPWFSLPKFIATLIVGVALAYVVTFKFVVPSIWKFRSKQMQQKDAETIEKLDKVIELLKPSKVPSRSIAISGGFDPLQPGHLSYIEDASKLGYELKVILSRDDQLLEKDRQLGFPKNRQPMPYEVRKQILEWGLRGRGIVVQNIDKDITSCESLRLYHPDIFAKGGDTWDLDNLPEAKVCKELGIEVVFGVGGFDKPYTSSQFFKVLNK